MLHLLAGLMKSLISRLVIVCLPPQVAPSPGGGRYTVLYDDGESCEEDFAKSKWRPAPSKHAMPHSSIAKEYNNGKALHDRRGEIISWVDRASKRAALPDGERDAQDRAERLNSSVDAE